MTSINIQHSSVLELNGKHFSFTTNKIGYDNLLFSYFHSDKCKDTKNAIPRNLGIFS